jgi:hypothetical protein
MSGLQEDPEPQSNVRMLSRDVIDVQISVKRRVFLSALCN